MKIFKYKLPLTKRTHELELPIGSNILTAQKQNNEIVLWAEVHGVGDLPNEIHKIGIFTDEFNELPLTRKYIATVQLGLTAWHLYELC